MRRTSLGLNCKRSDRSNGDLVLEDVTVGVLDLSGVADRLLGRSLPVILGAEIFHEMVVDIDYPNRRFAFREPNTWQYEGNGVIVPLIAAGAARLVSVTVEGGEAVTAGFDIGQGAAVTILKPHADAIGLLNGRANGTIQTGGVGGATIARLTTVASVTFGDVYFEDVPVVVPTVARGAFNTTRMQANLGTDIFSRFRMIVDYSRNRIILEPDDDALDRPFRRDRAGLSLERTRRGLEVTHVSEGSPAAEAGMTAGDVVTQIDGHAVRDDYWTGDVWRWNAMPAGTIVTVSTASGQTFRLQLGEYY